MQQLIENLWLEERFTSVLVTHDVEEAVTLSDRILVLEAGRIARDIRNDLHRPRRRDDPGFARLTGEILDVILRRPRSETVPSLLADGLLSLEPPGGASVTSSPSPTGLGSFHSASAVSFSAVTHSWDGW